MELDCRGLACPQPVLQCKESIESSRPDHLRIIVDNDAARQNVSRFLHSRDYRIVSAEEHGGLCVIDAESGEGQPAGEAGPSHQPESWTSCPPVQADRQLVFITSDRIGHGDDNLGLKLMENFLATLPEMGASLWRIILINAGVKLAVEGSGVLNSLRRLQDSGVSILVCGTCLGYFELLEKKAVGETTNMLDVVTSLELAGKVIEI